MFSAASKLFYHPTNGIKLKGIIFDMDGKSHLFFILMTKGTLTKPVLNFKLMRSRLGIPDGKDVLTEVKTYDPERKAKAMAIIDEIEGI